MSEFIELEYATSKRKVAIRKKDIKSFQEDTAGDTPCVKIEFHSGEWIKVRNKFLYILHRIEKDVSE